MPPMKKVIYNNIKIKAIDKIDITDKQINYLTFKNVIYIVLHTQCHMSWSFSCSMS